MFVIADCQHVIVPTFLLKILPHNGCALGTVDMRQTEIYKYKADSEKVLAQIQDHGPFQYRIHQLTIKL